jgi:hypothetical protein
MTTVYIAHSPEDRLSADLFAGYLQPAGYHLLDKADAANADTLCLLLLSPDAQQSSQVQFEIEYLRSCGSPIIPLMLRPCEASAWMNVIDGSQNIQVVFQQVFRALLDAQGLKNVPANVPLKSLYKRRRELIKLIDQRSKLTKTQDKPQIDRVVISSLPANGALSNARDYLERAGFKALPDTNTIRYSRGSKRRGFWTGSPRQTRTEVNLSILPSRPDSRTIRIRVRYLVDLPGMWPTHPDAARFWRADYQELENALMGRKADPTQLHRWVKSGIRQTMYRWGCCSGILVIAAALLLGSSLGFLPFLLVIPIGLIVLGIVLGK